MTLETASTVRRVRPSLHYRMVRPCDCCIVRCEPSFAPSRAASLLVDSLWICTRTPLVVVWTCLYICVLTLDFHSEYLTSTARVFTLKLFPTRMFELYINLHSCVALSKPKIFFFSHSLSSPAPDKAPTILSVTPHTTTSVLVRWQVRFWITQRCVWWMEEWWKVEGGIYWPELLIVWYVCWVLSHKETSSLCSLLLRIT